MDLLNMTNWEKIHDFYKKVRGNFYLPSHSFEIWCFLGGDGSCQQTQNFSKICLKYMSAKQHNTGTCSINIPL